MSLSVKRFFQLFVLFAITLFGLLFWLNTVAVEKHKSKNSDAVLANNAYFLYKKTPNDNTRGMVLNQKETVSGNYYSILVLREEGENRKIGDLYLDVLKKFNNREMFDVFVSGVDLEMFYRERIGNDGATDNKVLSLLSDSDLKRLSSCYSSLRKRYGYSWPQSLVPYFGRPIQNFDYFFDVRSKSCA